MNSKLTLSIDQMIIEDAKQYAKLNGKSLSRIVEEYLKALTNQSSPTAKKETSTLVRELRGSVRMPERFTSYEHLLKEALIDKHIGK